MRFVIKGERESDTFKKQKMLLSYFSQEIQSEGAVLEKREETERELERLTKARLHSLVCSSEASETREPWLVLSSRGRV